MTAAAPVALRFLDGAAVREENAMQIGDLRKEYTQPPLREAELDPDPVRQFHAWFEQALAAGLPEPNAMTLATATPDGMPAARTVLMKAYDEQGFTFFTNYEGRKGRELAANPRAALLFYWPTLQRQVRIEGTVERVTEAESDAYFRSRPAGSRLGAWASPQSEVIASRDVLERSYREAAEKYPDGEVPRPPYWGGFRVRPLALEFWQGRPDRLHDRLRYRRVQPAGWVLERLAP
jgi:pyridoxamine 5'-phosphate oxidase